MAEKQTSNVAKGAGPSREPTAPDRAGSEHNLASQAGTSTPLERIGVLFRAQRWPLICGAAGFLVLGSGAYWYFNHEKSPEPTAQLARALEALLQADSIDATLEARKIASDLDALRYRDPSFPGAIPFIFGIADFRRARSQNDRESLQTFRSAVARLEQARRGLDDAHRLEADFALGMSRHAIGDLAGSEEALWRVVAPSLSGLPGNASPQFFEAATVLQDIYLNQRGLSHLKRALELNDAVLVRTNLEAVERDRTLLRRARLFVALNEPEKAEEALARLAPETLKKRETIIIRAEVNITARHFKEAHAALEPLAEIGGLDSLYPRQAQFLLGVCFEAEKDFDTALRKYADTVRRFPDTPEALAGNVRRAELLRRAQRGEEALDAYLKALAMVPPSGFSNRWVQLEEFRNDVLEAWNDLIRAHAYEFAVELARHLRSLYSTKEASVPLERVATANQLWATELEAETATRPYRVREARRAEILERWRTSGKAHGELAEALNQTAKYADVLWISAEHYRKGHDFANALAQITRFIKAQPKKRLPLAYVRRGEILMDLDRFDEAIEHFDKVLAEFPTDIAAFQALYLIGTCELERNHPDRALLVWQQIIQENHLKPSANEWQAALFAVGRLQFEIAMTMKSDPAGGPSASSPVDPLPRPLAAYARLDAAIWRLAEFVARYPKRPEGAEARFLLAKALRNRSQLPREKLKRAETDNARKELQSEIQRLLTEAQKQLDTLVDLLQAKDFAGMLDPLARRMLRDSYFERAHNLYALDHFDRAIEAYTTAANRYPEDANVFLAYIQMANCYDRLSKPIDARGAAIQAMLIHKNMPDKAFTQDKTLMNRDDWKSWLEWARELRQLPKPAAAKPSSSRGSPA
jgi:tetratricopeptide (TPR) repeat protein